MTGIVCLDFSPRFFSENTAGSGWLYCQQKAFSNIDCIGVDRQKPFRIRSEPPTNMKLTTLQRFRGKSEEFGIMFMYGCEINYSNKKRNISEIRIMENGTLIDGLKFKKTQAHLFTVKEGDKCSCNEVCQLVTLCAASALNNYKTNDKFLVMKEIEESQKPTVSIVPRNLCYVEEVSEIVHEG